MLAVKLPCEVNIGVWSRVRKWCDSVWNVSWSVRVMGG